MTHEKQMTTFSSLASRALSLGMNAALKISTQEPCPAHKLITTTLCKEPHINNLHNRINEIAQRDASFEQTIKDAVESLVEKRPINNLNIFINSMPIEEAVAKFGAPLDRLSQVDVTSDFVEFNLFEGDLVMIDTRFDKITEEGVYALNDDNDKASFIRIRLLQNEGFTVMSKEGVFSYEQYCININPSFIVKGKVLPYKFGRI